MVKKHFFVLLCFICPVIWGDLKAQELAAFETPANDFFNTLAFDANSVAFEITDNPNKTGLNTSDKCLKNKRNTGVSWTVTAQLSNNPLTPVAVDDNNRYLHIYVYSPDAADGYIIFRTGVNDNVWDYENTYEYRFGFEAGTWKDIVVDLKAKNIDALYGIYFLSQDWGGAPSERNFYYDEIVLNADASLRSSNLPPQITIDAGTSYQTMEGFAASDCWTGHYVGKYWNDTQKNAIAKWLFSQNYKTDGSPEGIGLSMWRVNLGGGTIELGDTDDNIADIARRAECFLDENGNYDWSKQAGQQWFMQQAKQYGCEQFVAFSNTPLVRYTKNGKGYADSGANSANLQTDKYDDFADYLATVVGHFRQEGYNFTHISPVNEPQYAWDSNGQEGSPWTNAEIKKMVVELDKSIQQKGIDTKILITEAGSWDYLYAQSGHRAGNQIYQFFDSNSANYVGNLPSVAPVIGGHSYWTHTTNSGLRNTRASVKTKADNYNVGVYQTEWSMLNGGEGLPDDLAEASYMDIALFMAKVMHSDLVDAGVSSWSYWTALGQEQWSHKNRFLLIALRPGNPPGDYNPVTEPGVAYDRATLWALGNYSFFVRPGYQRIGLSGANDLAGLMGTAYISPDRSRIVTVYVNMAAAAQKIMPAFVNLSGREVLTNKVYVTTSSYKLQKIGGASSNDTYEAGKEISIPARSVATVVYELGNQASVAENVTEKKLNLYPNPLRGTHELRIELPGVASFENATVCISSINGSVVFCQKAALNSNSITINTPEYLSKGTYVVSVRTSQGVYRSKLIVQ